MLLFIKILTSDFKLVNSLFISNSSAQVLKTKALNFNDQTGKFKMAARLIVW